MFFASTFITSYAQVYIEGTLLNEKKEPQPQINILIYTPQSSVLIAYDVSDQNGNFAIAVDRESDSLILMISSVQFVNQVIRIPNVSQKFNIELSIDVKKLEALEVKAQPIEKRGDTLSYLVASFVQQEDRSIEDVLRRMPGVEISGSGKILYQGMPIQNLYVDGLDLMDGRYSVVSKNLPQTSVNSIEILENHQPMRVLEDKISSVQASINLKLSKGVVATGTAKLGLGYSPLLWDANITPMVFSKKIQVLSSYQTNNIGLDVSKQLSDLSLQDQIKYANRPSDQPKLIGVEGVGNPELEEDRYLNNNIHLANLNMLVRLANDFTLRTNIFYVNDYQLQQKALNTKLYKPSDTIEFNEIVNNQIFNNDVLATITLNKNTKKYYFNNKLKFHTNWNKSNGVVLTNGNSITQSLQNPFKALKNQFMLIRELGNQLLQLNSYISYDNSPPKLEITPGQFQGILNKDTIYEKSIQHVDLGRFYTQNSASMVFGWKRISLTPEIGFVYRKQNLLSNISIIEDNVEEDVGDAFINNLMAENAKIYFNAAGEYKYKGLVIKATIPISWNDINLEEKNSDQGQKLQRFYLDPKLNIDYKINGYWRANAGISLKHRLGDIDKVHYNYLLESYRVLSKNDAPIAEKSYYSFNSSIWYRNPINSFFNKLNYGYMIKKSNLIYSNMVQSDGTTIILATYSPNTFYYHNINFRTSKYISKFKSTLRLQLAFNHKKGQSLLNAELFETKNLLYFIKPGIYMQIFEFLNAEYNLESQSLETFVEKEKKSSLVLNRHKLNIFVYPSKNQLISFSGEYYSVNGKDNYFVDLLYRYSISKKRLDFELHWMNILNNKTYTSYQANDFNVWESSYLLRPSQLMASVKFNF
ncbi:MAG: hypothetical protein B7C24_06535 [Bacteroidetes bacterium 4572_77]|nr:MAG: hypothetical protein B7C24_06535 [Bacteroidetes bacterium 4572_77]